MAKKPMSSLEMEFQAALRKANAANEQRYNNVLKDAMQRTKDAMKPSKSFEKVIAESQTLTVPEPKEKNPDAYKAELNRRMTEACTKLGTWACKKILMDYPGHVMRLRVNHTNFPDGLQEVSIICDLVKEDADAPPIDKWVDPFQGRKFETEEDAKIRREKELLELQSLAAQTKLLTEKAKQQEEDRKKSQRDAAAKALADLIDECESK